jgi:hypothetical protein
MMPDRMRKWRTGKATGQMYQCWCRICREINVFARFQCPFVTYAVTLPPTYILPSELRDALPSHWPLPLMPVSSPKSEPALEGLHA